MMFQMGPYRGRRGFHPLWSGFSWPEETAQVYHSFRVDVQETEESYEIQAEIPGVSKENIGLDLNDGYLTITVKQDSTQEANSQNYIRRERRVVSSQRSFYVGNVSPEQIEAKYDNGILTVRLPKVAVNEPHRKIPIQ